EFDDYLDTAGTRVTTAYGYDANGRLTSITEPATDDGLTRTTRITSYDPTFHAYPSVVLDAKGFPTQRTYTPEVAVKTSIDANGAVTSFDYDGFGRKTRVTPPSSADQGYGPIEYSYNLTGNAYTQYVQTTRQVGPSNTLVEQDYFDGTGFGYRSQKT